MGELAKWADRVQREFPSAIGKIEVEVRSVYGEKKVYPICEKAKLFAEIAGTKPMTHRLLTQIEALEEQDEETFKYERQRSMAALRELIAQIERLKPVSKQEQMEKALRQAINAQEFERAAVLRDELRALRRPTQ